MSVFIRGQVVSASSMGSNTGTYFGQNIQNAWDSTSPLKESSGLTMGDFNVAWSFASGFLSISYINQWISDRDWKDNENVSISQSITP